MAAGTIRTGLIVRGDTTDTDKQKSPHKRAFLWNMARPRGFEPLTSASGGQRSIQLSYGRNES